MTNLLMTLYKSQDLGLIIRKKYYGHRVRYKYRNTYEWVPSEEV